MNSVQYNEIVDFHSDNVYRFILKNLKNTDDAQDVVQEAFSRLWKNKKKVDAKKAKSYLFTTAYHVMIDDIRKKKRERNIEKYETDNYSHNNHYSDLNEVLDKAISTLPELHRNLVLLRDYEGYSYKEIGKITDLNESQVKVYIFRARKTLKTYIGKIENVI